MDIRGPGLEKPLTCAGTCTFSLVQGTHWLDIRASGRTWTKSITVTEAKRVDVETPNPGARGLGIAGIITGGVILTIAGSFIYVVLLNCGSGGPYEGTHQCRSDMEDLPYWGIAAGAGAVVSAIGIGLFVSNNQPSLEVQPVLGNRVRREPGTFVGLAPVEGSTLPGLSLRASF